LRPAVGAERADPRRIQEIAVDQPVPLQSTRDVHPVAAHVGRSRRRLDPSLLPVVDASDRGDLRRHLRSEDPDERAYWMGALLREANTRDVWLFATADQIRSEWPRLVRHLGRSRAMWAWLLGLPTPEWPPAAARSADSSPTSRSGASASPSAPPQRGEIASAVDQRVDLDHAVDDVLKQAVATDRNLTQSRLVELLDDAAAVESGE
jgi:hypothetical protein